MSKIPFRVSDGLDGADKRAINIGYPDITNLTDGVNIQYFIDENTIQQYDENRKYKKFFAVIFNDRIYYAKRDVPVNGGEVAGPFNETHWQQSRTDPNWQNVITTPPGGLTLQVGAFISADPSFSDLDFILPRGPQNGDTVVIKDVSSRVSTMKLVVRTTDKVLDNGKSEYQLTYPKATIWITYDTAMDLGKGGWRINTVNPTVNDTIVGPTANGTQLSAGDKIFRRSSAGKITMILPRYANQGDCITTFDLEGMTPTNNVTLKVHPGSDASVGKAGQKSVVSKTTGWGTFVYSQSNNMWEVWDGDEFERWTKIVPTTPASNINLFPGGRIVVAGKTGTINFTLPPAPADGDSVKISLRNASKGVNINIKSSVGDNIRATAAMLGLPRLNEVTDYANIPLVTSLAHIATGMGEQFKFVYIESEKAWVIAEQEIAPFRASKETSVRNEPGLVFFANDAEVMKNSEDNPSDESAVTPLSLSRKTATEARRGIAKIATQAETNADQNDVSIVTPKKLHERIALEDRRGIAEIATQQETDAGTDDSRIVTPKKLAGRVATENLTGVASLVKVGATVQPTRTTKGTGINDFDDHSRIVTPKTLFEKKATETNLGLAFWATQTEVNGGAEGNFFVRPSTLQARTATPTRTGLARMVDMSIDEHKKDIAGSLDSNVFITPKALASRIATYTMDGITRAATNVDVTTGTDEVKYINPAKLKYFTDEVVSITAPDSDGLNITGTIWKGLVYKIDLATETKRGTTRLATQDEANAGSLDNVMITPRKLNGRTATTSRTGIVRLATPAEAAAGVLDNVAITPSTMGSVISESPEWGSTETRRGSVYTAGLTNDASANSVWQGNDIAGSTRAIANYKHDSYSVSPRGLNTALSHYLPIRAKAADSDKLDGLDSLQFMRSDIDTKTTGTLTSDKQLTSLFGKFTGKVVVDTQSAYIGYDRSLNSGRTDFVNARGSNKGGWNFWNGQTDEDQKIVVEINETGSISAEGITTSKDALINGNAEVKGELKYKGQTLDDRYVNVTGDTISGNVIMDNSALINFTDNGKTDGTVRNMIQGVCGTTDMGYIGVGATAQDAGFLEIGMKSSGNDPIYVRQRLADNSIRNTAALLDTGGNTVFPKTLTSDRIVARNTGTDAIAWGNKSGKLSNTGNLFGEVWGNKWLKEYLDETFNTKVDRAGDTITGSLTVKKDVIVEGSFKIKVGNKYLVIRPNAATETVSFDWE